MGSIRGLRELARIRSELRRQGRKVVLTNGCFDLLHVGHIRCLQAARDLGDVLIVGVNSDASVRRLKGEDRPLVPEAERAEVIAALEAVDYVVIFRDDTAERLVEALRPDVYVKGADYGPGARPLPEREIVEGYGGRVELVPLSPGHSTSGIIASVLERR